MCNSSNVDLAGAVIIEALICYDRFFVYDVDTQYQNLGVKVSILTQKKKKILSLLDINP